MDTIDNQLHQARQSLLDVSGRNRLLNFRPTRARTISIVDEISREVFDILVLNGNAMKFLPVPEKLQEEISETDRQLATDGELEEGSTTLTKKESSMLWRFPAEGARVSERHHDRFLQTALDPETLQKRLFHIYHEANSMLEEVGYSPLYLAIGFLKWRESPDSDQYRKSPLVLVPVELERTKVGASFALHWDGEDISTNISLQAALSEIGLKLPDYEMPDESSGIDEYLREVTHALGDQSTWRILDEIHLGFFSFTKFIMYRDLDPSTWPEGRSPGDHPLIKALFDPSEQTSSEGWFEEGDIDQQLTAFHLHHVEDADPSQIAVVEDVKRGRNLVVEGPPGTGKSQTITNMIAELLASNKTVLFVSEKMAALEVVKSRLDRDGLGDFCLELHSRKSKKKEVLQELERTITMAGPTSAPSTAEFTELEALKADLNSYAKALGAPIGKLMVSPHLLYCRKDTALRHLSTVGRTLPKISFTNAKDISQQEYDNIKENLRKMEAVVSLVAPMATHPWRGSCPGVILPADEVDLRGNIDKCSKLLSDLRTAIDHLQSSSGIATPKTFGDIPDALEAALLVTRGMVRDRDALTNPEWDDASNHADELIEKIGTLNSERQGKLRSFNEGALGSDTGLMLEEFERLSKRFLKLFSGRYRRLKKQIHNLYAVKPASDDSDIVSDLQALVKFQCLRDDVCQQNNVGRKLFGSIWNGATSDAEKLRAAADWIILFRHRLSEGSLGETAVDIVCGGGGAQETGSASKEVTRLLEELHNQFGLVLEKIGANYQAIFRRELTDIPFTEMAERLSAWATGLPKLQLWSQFTATREACLRGKAAAIVTLVDDDSLVSDDILHCFEANLSDDLLGVAFASRPALAQFVGDLHDNKISRFRQLDKSSITTSGRVLRHELFEKRPSLIRGASPGSQSGILLSEINRRRGHMPIRKLMSAAGKLIQGLKPCFMMSPLSIAQFLDPQSITFDVIIFDEASQVRPEDALGAFLRGGQVVVLGDSRQLPPTAFFDHVVESENDAEEDTLAPIGDLQSILHLCKTRFPSRDLRWHYRSKHESLIAVSNQEFYDNRLLLYPSSVGKTEELGLQLVHLPDAVYDRGRSSTNRREARKIAEFAVEHYRNHPDKSLGVGAFNIRQQQAILEEVELQLRQHPDMEDAFKSDIPEHFFVKNLETIQGDERDVIFVSVGFGFDALGKISRNFGPINQEGGQRRLNVLMTRARERCVIFSNFRAADLLLDDNSPWGLRALKVFLEYADSGELRSAQVDHDADSPFEEAVYEFLLDSGIEVRKQIGCAGFRVDLGIVDPRAADSFVLGIECDGAKYHMSPVARDRDRLRQQILEKLGWRIHRIWSTDWYRSPSLARQRLLQAAEQSLLASESPPELLLDSMPESGEGSPEQQEPLSFDDRESQLEDILDQLGSEYAVCSYLGTTPFGNLHEFPQGRLAEIVTRVVDVEGPVHVDEVVRRIRTLWGLGRAGNRIREAIYGAIQRAKKTGIVRRRGSFLWPIIERPVPVRQRLGDPPPSIDLVCDEEIAQTAKAVLRTQYATMLDDLVTQSSRVLGIRATSEKSSSRIQKVIRRMIRDNALVMGQNGMVDIADD